MTAAEAQRAEPILRAEDLVKHFPARRSGILRRAFVRAVDGVSFAVARGETFGLVGESGSGKSTLARLLLGLIPPTAGHVFFEGVDLMALTAREMRRVRREMQMIFQDPYASLNPRLTVGEIVAEPLHVHRIGTPRERRARVAELLELVGLEARHLDRHPHEFSGGQRQRIGIARALAANPKLLVLDEPVSALDVSVQSQVLNLLAELQARFHLTYVFIGHDLRVVEHMSDRVGVMYLGQLVEVAPKEELFTRRLHPYTEALLAAVPMPQPGARRRPGGLRGEVPSALSPPHGCRFHPRCPIAEAVCREKPPELREVEAGHLVRCHLRGEPSRRTEPQRIEPGAGASPAARRPG